MPLSQWQVVDGRNILSAANLARLRNAFGPSSFDNLVFGFHYYYAGGCGHTNLAARSAEEILRGIEASRPGDHFTLYSLAETAASAEAAILVDASALNSIDALLVELQLRSAGAELAVLFAAPAPELDVVWKVNERDVADLRTAWTASGRGEGIAYVFRMEVLDEDVEGATISSVTPRRPRIRALLDAKRPKPDGSTPSRGPY